MKRQDAFAFRDFDRARILQRPFFKRFDFDGTKTDAEILETLKFCDDDPLSELERKQETLNKILSRLESFNAWLNKHIDKRLGKYMRVMKKKMENAEPPLRELFQKKLAREQALVFYYSLDIPDDIGNLFYLVGIEEEILEEPLEEAYRNQFAERLKKARLSSGFTRQQLANVIKLSPNGFGQYETGRREPNITSLIRLSRKLNGSVDWLIGATP